jgi:TatD DNase family protein
VTTITRLPRAGPPEPLPAEALDSHTHLDMLDQPVPVVLAEARQAGITRVVTVGCDLESSRWAASCAAEHAGLYAAVAIHPNETAAAGSAGSDSSGGSGGSAGSGGWARSGGSAGSGSAAGLAGRDAVLAEIATLARLPRVRAVGETGLDYYRDSSPPQVQRDWFRAHIEIAKRTGKALMIHDRDAHSDVLAILDEEGPPEHVIFHCFSGDADLARRCASAGYVLSFAGTVTFSSATQLREAAVATPADQLLVETDAPFLTPVPNRGKLNAPAQVAHTLRAVAELKQLDVAELCGLVTATAERVFGPWSD